MVIVFEEIAPKYTLLLLTFALERVYNIVFVIELLCLGFCCFVFF